VRSQFKPLGKTRYQRDIAHDEWVGKAVEYATEVEEDDFVQARMLWEFMGKKNEQGILIDNVVGHMGKCLPDIKRDAIRCFARVDKSLGDELAKRMEVEI